MSCADCERPQLGDLEFMSSDRPPGKHAIGEAEAERKLKKLVDSLSAEDDGFRQSVDEVGQALLPLFRKDSSLLDCFLAMCHPERILIFRVLWEDDQGKLRVNTGYRVQHNSALGPYKGGLRFHPSVNLDVCRFLAFEQTLKNSLTGLAIGGAKGGADVNPKELSSSEMRRFCVAYMTELHRYIGPELDVPAGDIGVSSREIGYMAGTYTRLTQQTGGGALSSKPLGIGGSCLRTESTGFGIAVMAEMVLKELTGDSLKGLTVAISGAGNVALHCALKCTQMGAKVLTLSDSGGTLGCAQGFSEAQIRTVMQRKLGTHGKARLRDIADNMKGDNKGDSGAEVEYTEGKSAWHTPCDVAIPCATQREFDAEDLRRLAQPTAAGDRDRGGRRLRALFVGSNMGLTEDALAEVRKHVDKQQLVFAPDKLSNLAGVAVSYLEMTQNAQRGMRWKQEKVASVMRELLEATFDGVMRVARKQENKWDLWQACHVHAFMRVHEAMKEQGQIWQHDGAE